MYQKNYHIHFVGIGGIGMSGIAELLINLGYRVSGSDLVASDITRRLTALGGRIFKGHAAAHMEGADVLVVSSAVKADNPEILSAQQKGIPVIPRAEMLAELMRLKYGVAIAGAHGKTTTTNLMSAVLAEGGLDPTIVIGGKLHSLGTNARLGEGDFLVAEADESDGSFLRMSPAIAVVTNIDLEHLDHYRDIDDIKDAFTEFINKVPFYGMGVVCLDNEHVQNIIPRIRKRFVTYGLSRQADYRARDIRNHGMRNQFTVLRHGEVLGDITLNLPGRHNVTNALAAIAAGCELSIDFDQIRRALEQITGVARRMEIKAEVDGITIMDDYGHHPTEIRTTLDAVRESYPDRRLVVVFQPHRYTRTAALFDDFTRSFYESDALFMLPIYAAGEPAIDGITGMGLCEGVKAHGHRQVVCVGEGRDPLPLLRDFVKKGDLVLTLGAGNVYQVGEALAEVLSRAAAA
ncbi:UDP-N-acetylmuramate--L-alanine ligase [Desulfobotulus sp.]|jgi:UDP-N-acetylmuramate--alanine ligase|uniref:UDP-N-acetylmuramate--L-alanine ligase n=1 Tax=Desulfobotulus sp. TaxID=1940337 RepID=UPI002A36BB56|nr:UDP-N-acetylmuramate--L-alanine ligase [Desulfobotulus sp.]MDY0164007.1 UDP-N-acetylmuramate--L-alanine ligase [Desulfobotulus sp.]